MRHPHADLIHLWAEGAEIEYKTKNYNWSPVRVPTWDVDWEYRIKPKETPWYENIPAHGVLCWVSDTINDPDKDSQVSIVMHKAAVFNTHKGATWTYATPLTDNEIRMFLRGEK